MLEYAELIIKSLPITGKVKNKLHEREGQSLQSKKIIKHVVISIIPKTGNKILDTFIIFQDEALAITSTKDNLINWIK